MNYKIMMAFLISSITFLTFQSFAVLEMNITGEVISYDRKTGVYVVHTKAAIVTLYNSKLTPSVRRALSRRIGKQVEVTLPHTAVIAYSLRESSKKSKRKPTSIKKDQTKTQRKAK